MKKTEREQLDAILDQIMSPPADLNDEGPRPNWWFILSLLFCFITWWLITTTFVSCMAPYMGNYR